MNQEARSAAWMTRTSNVHGAVYVFKYGRWFRLLHCGCCWAVGA